MQSRRQSVPQEMNPYSGKNDSIVSFTDSSRSTSTSSFGDVVGLCQLRHIPSEGLLAMIRREESVSAEGVGFQSKYEPKEILGRGLSSTVRKCVSRDTGIEYAVKIIDKSQDEAITESIANEMAVLGYLPEHKHIINLQDVYESPAFVFMVFELATGGELFDYLTSMVKLSEKKTRQIMYQVFLAVEHMHSHGVVHRDLKPENILLDDQNNVKVSDFGFSTIIQPGQTLSELLGTPGYLAPEMLKKSVNQDSQPGYGKEVDILVGFPPFWHRKQLVMLRSIMDGNYEFVSPEWDDISEQAKDLIRKLLVTDPKRRITATEALTHSFLQFQPVTFKMFSARRRFKGLVYCIWSCAAFEKMRRTPKAITLASVGLTPYENRFVRSLIDACAFQIYSHWVKRGEEQNRAALFENIPKKYSPLSSTSINVHLHGNSDFSRMPLLEQQLSGGSNVSLIIS